MTGWAFNHVFLAAFLASLGWRIGRVVFGWLRSAVTGDW